MPSLAEEFAADQQSREQSRKFQLEQEFREHLRDRAQGGSLRQAPIEANPPIGAVIGGVGTTLATGNPALGVLGATAGEAGQQLLERAIGDPAAPTTTGEAALRMGREALTQGTFEVIGGGGSFLMDKARAFAPFAKSITPEAKEAIKFVEQHGGPSQSLLPAEMTSNRFLDILQNVSEHSLLGGGAIETFKRDRDLFNTTLAQTLVARHGPHMDADAVGRAVVDSATRNLEAAKFQSKFIYQAIESQAAPQYAKSMKKMTVSKDTEPIKQTAVDRMSVKRMEGAADEEGTDPELRGLRVKTSFQDIQVGEQLQRMRVMVTEQENQIGGTRIDLRPLKDELAGLTKTSEESGGLADAAMGNTLLTFINKKPDLVSYPVAKAIRTEVRAYRDQLQGSLETKNAPGIGKANTVYAKLTERIRAGLADDDPFLATMWDEANLIEAGANQQFNTKFIRELVKLADMRGKGAPEAVAEKVWRTGRPTQVKVVRNALDPIAWEKMQHIEMERLMQESFENGVPNGRRMEAALFGPSGLGEDVLQAGFNPATVRELKGFVNALKLQQAKQGDSTGRVWIQLAQATAAVGVIGDIAGVFGEDGSGPGLTSAGATILLGPAVVGRLLTKPGAMQWLTEGLTASPKSAKYLNAVTQIAKVLEAGIPRLGPDREPAQASPSTQVQPMGNQE